MGKRLKAAALCCVLAACMVPALTGCSNNKTTYTPETKSPVVASPAIGQDGTLRVGVDAENPPLSGMVESDNTSKIAGLDVDVAAALADELGLKLSIVDVGNDPEGALAEGKVDIVMGIDRSTSDVAFWCSDPYLPTGVVLLSLSADAPVPTASSGATFAAQVSSRSAWSVMNEFGEESLTSTNNLVEALNALSTGTVQYVATDAVRGISAAKQPHVDVHMIALMQQPGGYCVGVADENSELKTAVADAVATLKKHYQKKPLLPKAFSAQNHIEQIQGVYVPFWLFSGSAEGDVTYKCTRSMTRREGDYDVTDTQHYLVRRAGSVTFEKIPVDASSKMPDENMDSIEPFDYQALKPFSNAYLPGFLADQYDVSVEQSASRADTRCKANCESALRSTVTGYTTCTPETQTVRIRRGQVQYALLPVWMLHTKWKGKDYLFSMNGQTGKLTGDLPVSWGRFWAYFAGIAGGLAAVLSVLLFAL